MEIPYCEICNDKAEGEITYDDGEILVGCGPCLLEIMADPAKPVHSIHEYEKEMK